MKRKWTNGAVTDMLGNLNIDKIDKKERTTERRGSFGVWEVAGSLAACVVR